MTSKSMNEVEVSRTETGSVRVHQFHDEDSQEYGVVLAREQVPLVADWMLEAAGYSPTAEGGRKREELRAQAHLFRRLEGAAAGGPTDRGSAIEAIRVALEWAAGESDLSPDEWHHLFDVLPRIDHPDDLEALLPRNIDHDAIRPR